MTLTDTDAPTTAAGDPAAGHPSPLAPPRPATGFAALIGTADHKVVGRLWIATSLLFLLVAGISGGLLGIERIDVGGVDVVATDALAEVFSLHAVAGTFLFLLPLLIGLGTYVVPLQVGSTAIAFPRAAAAAYWTYLLSGATVMAAFIAGGGPGGADRDAIGLFLAAMIAVLVALCLASICVATTGIALRAPGMGLHRAPLFTWSNIVAATLWLLTLPVLAAVLLLLYVDVRYGPAVLGEGANDTILIRMAWAWNQPSVYVFAIPVLGIVGDIVPVAARTRLTLHRVAMGAVAAFGIFSYGAWAMPGFSGTDSGAPTLDYADELPFVANSFLVLLPLVVLAGLLADTLRRGAVRLLSGLVWAVAALLMLLTGAANGALVAIEPLDLITTTAVTAQIHYVLVAALLGAFAALAHWSPKIWGRPVAEGASTVLAIGGLLGCVLLALPDLVSGFLDQPARFGAVTDDESTIEALNIASVAGGGLLVVVALAFLGLVLRSAVGGRKGDEPSEADPWEGHTLEWATSSPPPVGNFAELPPITSEAPVYDARHAAEGTS